MAASRLGALTLVAAVVATAAVHGAADGGDALIRDDATLPERIHACGHEWVATGALSSAVHIRAGSGADPVVVDPRWPVACPRGACSSWTTAVPCAESIYVRVGTDDYFEYTLSAPGLAQ